MSGIAGILNLDGCPVTADGVEAMSNTMAHRGPDGRGHWIGDGIALAHCLLASTPEAVGERQPSFDERSEVCLTFDGRLDNRDELCRDAAMDRTAGRATTDAEIVIAAYRRWGAAMVPRLLGDFAFALWDGRRHELLCGRDYLGKRPFYYFFDGARFRFASEPQAVLLDPIVPRVINEGMIGEFLAGNVCSRSETLFAHLQRLPAAHTLTLRRRGLTFKRYWQWDPEREVRMRSDTEYAAALLELLKPAVQACLRVKGPVGAELSGGVDSSSVVGIAQALRRDAGEAPLETYSSVYPGWSCDESEYIDAVVRYWGLVSHRFVHHPVPAQEYEDEIERYLDLPDDPNGAIGAGHLRLARDRGASTILTGRGGDDWFTGSSHWLADLVNQRRWADAAQVLRLRTESAGYRGARRLLWHGGLRPLIPSALRDGARWMLGRRRSPPWIMPAFRERVNLEDRLSPTRPRTSVRTAREFDAYFEDGWVARANELTERYAAWLGQEVRDPLEDRRVAEFGLAIPEEQTNQHLTTSKYVLRGAVAGLIPDEVRLRANKAEFSEVLFQDMVVQGGSALFRNLAAADRGFVDGTLVAAVAEEVFATGPRSRNLWALWETLSVDRWLRIAA